MPKAISNIDTAFFEDVTAMSSRIDEWCQHLSIILDHPAQLELLTDIYRQNKRIKQRIFSQRERQRRSR